MRAIRLNLFALAVLIAVACGMTVPAQPPPQAGTRVTFNREIAPLLYRNCVGCHRPGQVAPFSLLAYQDAAKRARQLAEVTTARYMPPWKPEPGYGEFLHARRLSDAEIALLRRWADSGATQGGGDAPPAPKFSDEWQMGEPDVILEMPQPFTVHGDGPDVFQSFVIPIDIPGDRYVSGFEFKPGNRRVLHHSVSYLDMTGTARKLDAADPDIGYRSFGGPGFVPTGALGGWSPGASAVHLPPGVAQLVRKGTDLVLQNHYHPTGRAETDQSSVGIYFSKAEPNKLAISIPLLQQSLDIPPGVRRHKVTATLTTPIDLEVIAITPHMHFLGREMKVTAVLSVGKIVPLIWIRDWNYNWHSQYQYTAPVLVPANSRFEMEAYFDNSAENPRNPNDPPERVGWGSESTDEMALCFLQVAIDKLSDLPLLIRAAIEQPGFARRSLH